MKYRAFASSEEAIQAISKQFDKLEEGSSIPELGVFLVNTVSDFAASTALRAVAAYMAEQRPENREAS